MNKKIIQNLSVAPGTWVKGHIWQAEKGLKNDDYEILKRWDLIFRPGPAYRTRVDFSIVRQVKPKN